MKAAKLVAIVLCLWAWCGTVAVGQQEAPAKEKPAKTAKKAPSPNAFRLTVVTRTGSGNKYGNVRGSKIFVALNGGDAHRQRLRNRDRDDFLVGAIDTFEKLRFDYPIDDIKTIQVKVQGADMWKCEWITFQFFKGGKQSKVYKFTPDRFVSGAAEKKVFHAVPFLEFKLTPKLEDPAQTAKPAARPAEKQATTIE